MHILVQIAVLPLLVSSTNITELVTSPEIEPTPELVTSPEIEPTTHNLSVTAINETPDNLEPTPELVTVGTPHMNGTFRQCGRKLEKPSEKISFNGLGQQK